VKRWVFAVIALLGSSAAAAQSSKVHEVVAGESLWSIAGSTVGDPTLWPALYRANRDQIKAPSVLYPGQKLTIPVIEPSQRQAVRREAEALDAK